MIDTLKRFLNAHWPKILSILAVAVFVIGLTFSCGLVNSKAYESFSSRYTPTNIRYTLDSEEYTYTLTPSYATYQIIESELAPTPVYVDDSPTSAYYYAIQDSSNRQEPIGIALLCPSAEVQFTNYTLHWDIVDMTPYYNDNPSLSYDSSISPLSYIRVTTYAGNPDDYIHWVNAIIEYTTYSSEAFNSDGQPTDVQSSVRKQLTLDPWDMDTTASLYDLIDPASLDIPSNSVITAVEIDLMPVYLNSELVDPDERPNTRIEVAIEQSVYPEWARVSNMDSFRMFLNSIRGLPSDGSGSFQEGYDVGYAEGKNVGLTQNLGITRWLTDAGDSVLGMRIFQVHTPHFVDGQYQPLLVDVTLGNILGVFLGGFLLIFILKMFAGG